jgi:putative oxidoreductase
MSKFLNNLQPWGAFLMRIVLGASMMYHGYSNVVPAGGFHRGNTFSALDHYAHFIASLGLPYWLGYVSAFTEFLGGFLILLGLLTRFVAFMIACNMVVAVVMVNRHHGYAGSEYSLALVVIAFMLLFYGPGTFAADRKIGLS